MGNIENWCPQVPRGPGGCGRMSHIILEPYFLYSRIILRVVCFLFSLGSGVYQRRPRCQRHRNGAWRYFSTDRPRAEAADARAWRRDRGIGVLLGRPDRGRREGEDRARDPRRRFNRGRAVSVPGLWRSQCAVEAACRWRAATQDSVAPARRYFFRKRFA
jgi:hypothetical protein